MANKRLNAIITIGGAVASSLMGSLTTTRTRIGEVGGELRRLERQQRSLSGAIDTFARQGRNVDGLRDRYRRVTDEIVRQRRELERLRAVQRNTEHRDQLRTKMGETAAVGAAIVLPAGLAVKRSSDFAYQLQVIGNTADMSKDQVGMMGMEILKISDEVGKSAQTVQGALGFLVAAGMDIDKSRGVLRAVGRTATATASEIEDVAKASFTLNDALDIEPKKMQGALDMLVQAGKEGNFEFKDMAAELPVLAAGLQALKMKGPEAVATIGAALQIARKGAGTSAIAATNVENFIAKAMSPETLKKATKLGSDMYGVISKAQKKGENPFEAAIFEINRITKGGDQKLLGELFQDMQVQNFIRPMLQNLEEYQRIKKAAFSAEGVTDRDFIKMSETTKQQLTGLADAAGRASIAIGSSLEPAVQRVTSVLTPVVRTITDFTNENKNLVGGSILVVGALTGIRLASLAVGYGWTFLKGAALSLAPVLRVVGSALMFTGRAFLMLGSAMFLNPIGLAITAVALLAGGAYLIYKNWEPLKAWFGELWKDITGTFDKAVKFITDKIDWVGEKWRATKSWLGFGGDTPAPAVGSTANPTSAQPTPQVGNAAPPITPVKPAAPPSMKPPSLVPYAPGRGASLTPQMNDNRQFSFHIAPQPGQSPQQIADEVERRIRSQQGVSFRSAMYDHANP